jgi:hypothetical protein
VRECQGDFVFRFISNIRNKIITAEIVKNVKEEINVRQKSYTDNNDTLCQVIFLDSILRLDVTTTVSRKLVVLQLSGEKINA